MLNKHFEVECKNKVKYKIISEESNGTSFIFEFENEETLYVCKEYFDVVKVGDTLLTITIPESEVYDD